MSTVFRCNCGCRKQLTLDLCGFDVALTLSDGSGGISAIYLPPHSAAEMAAELANKALEAMERVDKEQ
jgi:hypothetical protein